MRGKIAIGLGVSVVAAVCGCSGGDPAPSSTVEQPQGGSGGVAGTAGTLSLGVAGGGAGTGGGPGGAAGSTGAGVAGSSAGTTQGGTAGSPFGGTGSGGTSHGGSSSGSGGSKPAGTCKRASGSDADCADFDETAPQAYACDDASAYSALNGMHGGVCYSVSFVAGTQHGACCPP